MLEYSDILSHVCGGKTVAKIAIIAGFYSDQGHSLDVIDAKN